MKSVNWLIPKDRQLYQYLAELFAKQPLMEAKQQIIANEFNLFFNNKELVLQSPDRQQISINFAKGKYLHRLRFGGGRQQTISKACSLNKNKRLDILDATAGMARDALVLASLNQQGNITLCEQHPALFALIAFAIEQGRQRPELAEICQKMHIINQNAIEFMLQHPEHFDVVYLDPMYPKRKKSAKVKKAMQVLQQLITYQDNEQNLLHSALGCARKRVVVKRPLHGNFLADKVPDIQQKSKNTRFDIYFPKPAQ